MDSLSADVSTLQSELTEAQDQHPVRMDLVTERSGCGLAREHLAQSPVAYKLVHGHPARASGTG